MIKNRDEYKNMNDTLSKPIELNNFNPMFDDHDESITTKPLLNNSNNDDDEQSPYEEVAANISNKDDPTMLCLTFRSVFIGILLTCLMSFASQFFSYRTSPLDINIGLIILLAYMMGEFMSKVLPEKIFNITINPGAFSIKEHALITIMATSAIETTHAIQVITVERVYYNYYVDHVNGILFILVMHLLAFSIAGILKRYLVWPASMIWPKTLMSCCLMRTLNIENQTETTKTRWTMSRSKFFWLVVLFQFLWYWFPGYIFPLLSMFSFICMIAPHNIVFSQITGANGLGLGVLQFDWNACVSFFDSPILVPFWAHVNLFVGFIIVIWILTPIIYYTNTWDSKKMPIISNRAFDVNGNFYDPMKILNKGLRFNETAYEIYGGIRMTAAYAVSYGFILAAFSAYIVHTALYHGKFIIERFRMTLSDKKNDIHAKLMSHYPQVSEWWYYIILFLSFILGLIYCYSSPLLPGYIMIVAIIVNFIMMIPTGVIVAVTNMTFILGVPIDIFSSLIVPVHYTTAIYLLNHIPNICTHKNLVWKCLKAEGSYTSSILWGAIGFVKIFSISSIYFPLLFGLLVGLVLPIISWLLWKKFPNIKWLALIHFPIILVATNSIPPAPASEYTTWFLVGFIFNFILYRYAHAWWEKYAYVFSAAMSCGVVICGFIIFITLQNNNIEFPEWWGTGGPTRDGCPLEIANYSGFVVTDYEL
ncbi:unnamed protein product [Rotaria sp. Silwood1]|nr:unnamed protein product [Rotaria sp. Silwood1]